VRPVREPRSALDLELVVNGQAVRREVPARLLLSDFLRDELGLTGTHVGCEEGVCGACTVLVDGAPTRSCLALAVQLDGAEVTTIEGLSPPEGLSPMQQAFKDNHALQCGFCTPGILTTLAGVDPADYPDEQSIRALLSGNLCRCTGYDNIVAAVREGWHRSGSR
jgi:carbon-monoxide dehydrogenase small subunit